MALDFDGTNDFVTHGDIAAIDGASVLSWVLWMNPRTLEAFGYFWSKWEPGNGPFAYINASGAVSMAFDGVGTRGSTPDLLTVDTWAHLGFAYDGGGADNAARLRGYVDGIERVLSFTGTIPATISTNAIALEVGRLSTDYFDCTIGHFRMWSAALTAAEMAQEMNTFRPARTANLFLWSPYDDGTSARDYSGSGNHGTVTEAVQFQGPPVSYGGQS